MCIAAAWTGLACNSPRDFIGLIILVTQYCKEPQESFDCCIFLLFSYNFLPLVHSLLFPHVMHIQSPAPGRSQWQKMYQKSRTLHEILTVRTQKSIYWSKEHLSWISPPWKNYYKIQAIPSKHKTLLIIKQVVTSTEKCSHSQNTAQKAFAATSSYLFKMT